MRSRRCPSRYAACARSLDLRSNGLEEAPVWLADLPALQRLDLRWNRIAAAGSLAGVLEARGCRVLL
jgi:hypothetical protein